MTEAIRMPSVEDLRKQFYYDPDTGKLYNRRLKREAGGIADGLGTHPYRHVTVSHRKYKTHRLI